VEDEQARIDLRNFPKGIYFVKLQSAQNTGFKKLIKL